MHTLTAIITTGMRTATTTGGAPRRRTNWTSTPTLTPTSGPSSPLLGKPQSGYVSVSVSVSVSVPVSSSFFFFLPKAALSPATTHPHPSPPLTALPVRQTLLEPLANNVKSMDDMDEIIARLQREKRSLSTAEKLSLWETVLDRVMCRFVCVVWLVPMLQLLVRVQLNVMGRTLYLQMSLRNERGRGRGGRLPRGPRASPLSGRAQEAYLRLSEHVVYQGCYVMRDMAKEISSATAAAFVEELGSVGATTRAASVAEAVGRALGAFERERLEGDGWREWERTIIPDDDEVSALFDGAELGPGERFEVEGMWRETVGVYRSEAFRTRYLAGCARAMASGMLRELAEGGWDRGDGGGDGGQALEGRESRGGGEPGGGAAAPWREGGRAQPA